MIDNRFRPLFDKYNGQLKPLVAQIEGRFEKFETPLLENLMHFWETIVLLHDGLESKMKWFFSPYWLKIDNGEFWRTFYTNRQMVVENIVLAKENESLNADEAMYYYAKVYEGYINIENLIGSHKLQMCWSLVVRIFYMMSHFMNWLVLTVLGSVIAAAIGYFLV